MRNEIKHQSESDGPFEYVVIGAGPAGICTAAKLYGSGVPGEEIAWLDPKFKVGNFGTTLSDGSSVPGNTAVKSYQKVNRAIYEMIPTCAPTAAEEKNFEMTTLLPETTCSLKVAAQPLQHITEKLRQLVTSVEESVSAVDETKDGIRLKINLPDGTTKSVLAKRVILATGAEPKTISLPGHITTIDPNVAFIKSKLEQYLNVNPNIKEVVVIGSSHSAALATMHLLQAGIHVKQFMNKEYKFATPAIAADGTPYTQFDNTGLKGEVATFTHQLLNGEKMHGMWECHVGKNINATHLSGCTHAVVCIGYKPSSSLQINGLPLAAFKYDKHSTQMMGPDGRLLPGMFVTGAAFPPEVRAPAPSGKVGEVELAVGVGKFWPGINEKVLATWENCPAKIPSYSNAAFLRLNGIFRHVQMQPGQRAQLHHLASHNVKAELPRARL